MLSFFRLPTLGLSVDGLLSTSATSSKIEFGPSGLTRAMLSLLRPSSGVESSRLGRNEVNMDDESIERRECRTDTKSSFSDSEVSSFSAREKELVLMAAV